MTESPRPVTDADLHAFVDGALDEARQREVAAHLAAHPEDAARVTAYEAQNAALHVLFDPILDEPVAEALRGPARRGVPRVWAAAAAVALLAAGTAAGWYLHATVGTGSLEAAAIARRAAVAHAVYAPEVRHPVEVTADEEAHLVKWLSNRLGAPLRAPRLSDQGYDLVGGRLLPGTAQPAAQFMYENSSGERVTLYITTELHGDRETAFRYVDTDGVGAFYWIDGLIGYALTGEADKPTLFRMARLVYEQLNP